MAAGLINSTNPRVPGVREITRTRADARRRPLRNRLALITPDTEQAIRYAGGWLFDQALAGWEVTVHVATDCDVRPLEILGARPMDFGTSMRSHTDNGPWPQALAVCSSLFEADGRVRAGVLDTIDTARADLRIWGASQPVELAGRCQSTVYELSFAARAFKRRAFAAAGLAPETMTTAETFLVVGSATVGGGPSAAV
ncbi:hypothetical protein [Gordonia sp. (in: high G+C Gram-positive bacteria)]|jgi:hypothetical protein|uniref:hypothetical protein n=1 Tax=Gordonia sp. (in: high G+C Gram-positive bacteria) TaxID=84139 RepID=UPI0019BF98C4|nr:hypothetical protein [Gordonia sp. (in: high G+C Gram-positive bacteria)]MBD0021668.1 hypothetical protein [Gordonia sp. (in: high G+C Gram-positive bacteria)]